MLSYAPSGSSSGSIVVVAANLVGFAIGILISYVNENVYIWNKQAFITI